MLRNIVSKFNIAYIQFIQTLLFGVKAFSHNKIKMEYGAIWLKPRIRIKGRNNKVEIGKNATLRKVNIKIDGDNNSIIIGDRVKFYEWGRILIEGNDCEIKIGNKSTIGSAELLMGEPNTKIQIGENCMFSRDISINTSDFHSVIDVNTGSRINHAANVFINSDVWIGNGVYISKGGIVPKGCVVATKALITGGNRFENNSLLAGIPGKCIRKGVSWSREKL